ncbi:ankyrin repeat domain-containing protein [Paenibacillus psychroresistens]|uniref:Ankyrin repeat domain-containing protein n=1 Tax=Paenibacillus psychroresistens TaxID=1778678 RepID=A0A6B8RE38_9BACL|nr:ankyrin repeat domain-containing protein [Paenibacillus psychroresistens]QGQ93738.1 ankyrin repeat domain-containing protein [Paenibacillus psychroresistens]
MNDLFDALLTEDLTLLMELLEAGCDVNAQDEEGRTALIQAALYNNVEVVQILIEHGANVNTRDFFNGYAALHFAARNSSLELMQLLLKHKAEVDIKDINGNTPLLVAVINANGKAGIIQQLLLNGADRNTANNQGVSPLELANTMEASFLFLK